MMSAPPVFVINLDRAEGRWSRISGQAEALGVELRRVSAVDGREIPPEDWIDVDFAAFRSRHGRGRILPGEYGCHRSHLMALEAMEDSGAPYGLILEDDLILSAEGLAETRAIAEAGAAFDAVKLMNHRVRGFLPKFSTPSGLEVGLALHGPLGSSAAYLVSREGARNLRRRLARMTLPVDVELERYWSGGGVVYTTRRNLFAFSDPAQEGGIGGSDVYKTTKLPAWRRLPTLGFRAQDYLKRVAGALRGG